MEGSLNSAQPWSLHTDAYTFRTTHGNAATPVSVEPSIENAIDSLPHCLATHLSYSRGPMAVPVRGVVHVLTSLETHFGSVGHEKGLQLVGAGRGYDF